MGILPRQRPIGLNSPPDSGPPVASGKCRLTLHINGALFRVHPDPANDTDRGRRAFRLKGQCERCTVTQADNHVTCNCPVGVSNRPEGQSQCCHALAMVAAGLLRRSHLPTPAKPVPPSAKPASLGLIPTSTANWIAANSLTGHRS